MEFLERLQQHSSQLTNKEQKIADYIVNHHIETLRANLNELAELCGSSRSAVLRFTQKLGYSGFTEFRYDFSLFVHAGQATQQSSVNRIQMLASYYEAAIRKISEYVSEELMEEIVLRIAHARKVKIFGLNRNSYSALQLRHHFHTLNFDAEAVSDTVLIRDLPAAAQPGDVHIYFSVSGATPIIRDAIQASAQHGACTILITMHRDGPMVPYAAYQVLLPSTWLVTTDYFLDQQAINFIFIEMLIVYLGHSLSSDQKEEGGTSQEHKKQ